eukprot:9366461-Heterocapsa_arctica.AAC.1
MTPCHRSYVRRSARVAERGLGVEDRDLRAEDRPVMAGIVNFHVTVGGCGRTLHSIAVSQPMSST